MMNKNTKNEINFLYQTAKQYKNTIETKSATILEDNRHNDIE